jgi:RsiW-degrading membrane proteinase PrsW (M82 family)
MPIIIYVFIVLVAYITLTVLAVFITDNRKDDTPLWEVLLLCIFFSPVLAIILEMLKPYKPQSRVVINNNSIGTQIKEEKK